MPARARHPHATRANLDLFPAPLALPPRTRTPHLNAPGMWYLFIPGVPLLFFVLLFSKRHAIMERSLRDGSSEIDVYSVS